MRTRSLVLLGGFAAALAGCADAGTVTAPDAAALGVNATRTVYVDATTRFLSPSTLPSGGYAKGWATPVGGGTGYQMGDVEADGTDGADFVELTGYTGQLDAFEYDPACTFRWRGGTTIISTASTIYLANYPNVSYFTLELTCP